MSLILEALKKSERQRHASEMPTFAVPVIVGRRRRSLLPFLFVTIMLALGVGWWLLHVPRTPPANAPVASVPPAPGAPANAAPSYIETTPSPTPPAPPSEPTTARPARSDGSAANNRPGTPPARPGSAGQPPGSVVLPPMISGPEPGSVAGLSTISGGAVRPPTVRSPNPPAPPAEPRVVTAPPPPANAPPAPPPTQLASAAPPAPPPAAPPAPNLPTVWDLPYATRKGLPEITLTMHVYSADPRGRFVIVEGDRHMEGDTLGGGVTLREIRPDGMVLDFHGQQFLYPRDGR